MTSIHPVGPSSESQPRQDALREVLLQRRACGHLSPRSEAALQLLAARLAGGGPEAEVTPVDVGVALSLVDELYRADADYFGRLEAWASHVSAAREFAIEGAPVDDRAVLKEEVRP